MSLTPTDSMPPGPSSAAPDVSDPVGAAIRLLAAGSTPDEAMICEAFRTVVDGGASDAAIAALLMGLRCRGETPEALVGAARAIRERMLPISTPSGAIDVAGTGGDGGHTLNVSTAVAFVVRGCGVPIAKLGNRAFSSLSGSSDVLNALGLDPDPPLAEQAARLDEQGIAFLYGPRHLAALRHAAAARRALGIPTLLNLAATLCNPHGVRRQLLGVFDPAWLEPIARGLATFGLERAWVVHGDGLDELTLSGDNQIVVLDQGAIERRIVTPEEAGFKRVPRAAIRGGTPDENASALEALLDGAPGAYRDTVLLNTAAALVIAGVVRNLREGIARASIAIDNGDAVAVLRRLRGTATPSASSQS